MATRASPQLLLNNRLHAISSLVVTTASISAAANPISQISAALSGA
jgi:hypothetical protein